MAKFLYIEDDDMFRKMASAGLAQRFPQDQFVPVANYHEAVAALRAQSFDGIVSDWNYSGIQDEGIINRRGLGTLDLARFLAEAGNTTSLAYYSGNDASTIQKELRGIGLNIPANHIFGKAMQDPDDAVDFLKTNYCPEARKDAEQAIVMKTGTLEAK